MGRDAQCRRSPLTSPTTLAVLATCLLACDADSDPRSEGELASSTTTPTSSDTDDGEVASTGTGDTDERRTPTDDSKPTTTGSTSLTTGSSGGTDDDSTSTGQPPEDTETEACQNGLLDLDETDVDCGGSCGACPTGSACLEPSDCEGSSCVSGSCLGPAAGCDLDDVQNTPGGNWFDSYSADGRCYCDTTFDHAIGDISVPTPAGPRTVREVCDAIGPGPGREGNPVYNDIQCGNGPANDAGDEDWCPGRVDQGRDGCCTIGPRWDLSVFE